MCCTENRIWHANNSCIDTETSIGLILVKMLRHRHKKYSIWISFHCQPSDFFLMSIFFNVSFFCQSQCFFVQCQSKFFFNVTVAVTVTSKKKNIDIEKETLRSERKHWKNIDIEKKNIDIKNKNTDIEKHGHWEEIQIKYSIFYSFVPTVFYASTYFSVNTTFKMPNFISNGKHLYYNAWT